MMHVRDRRASDVASGIELKREDFPEYNDDEIDRHFKMFKMYDLDSSGFISAENLLDVLQAMEVTGMTLETVQRIIEECAILTGHDNDGKLSFRDYMHAIRYDKSAVAHNAAIDAVAEAEAEQRLSQIETDKAFEVVEIEASQPEAKGCETGAAEDDTSVSEEPAQEELRARRGSMSALNALATSRIKAFQQLVGDASAREKLTAFKAKPVEMSGPMVNSDELHKETLKNKVKAFEVAATYKGEIELRKTWRKVGGAPGQYAPGKKIILAGQPTGVAPKKKLSELP